MNEKCAQRHWKRQWLGRQWLAEAHGSWNTKSGEKADSADIVTATLSGFKRPNKFLLKVKIQFYTRQNHLSDWRISGITCGLWRLSWWSSGYGLSGFQFSGTDFWNISWARDVTQDWLSLIPPSGGLNQRKVLVG